MSADLDWEGSCAASKDGKISFKKFKFTPPQTLKLYLTDFYCMEKRKKFLRILCCVPTIVVSTPMHNNALFIVSMHATILSSAASNA